MFWFPSHDQLCDIDDRFVEMFHHYDDDDDISYEDLVEKIIEVFKFSHQSSNDKPKHISSSLVRELQSTDKYFQLCEEFIDLDRRSEIIDFEL